MRNWGRLAVGLIGENRQIKQNADFSSIGASARFSFSGSRKKEFIAAIAEPSVRGPLGQSIEALDHGCPPVLLKNGMQVFGHNPLWGILQNAKLEKRRGMEGGMVTNSNHSQTRIRSAGIGTRRSPAIPRARKRATEGQRS